MTPHVAAISVERLAYILGFLEGIQDRAILFNSLDVEPVPLDLSRLIVLLKEVLQDVKADYYKGVEDAARTEETNK